MYKTLSVASLTLALALAGFVTPSQAYDSYADRYTAWFAARLPWHGGYYHQLWGRPVPMVVPPTARMYTQFNWGVSTNEMRPVYHQFARPYPGDIYGGEGTALLPAPYHPSSTREAGVYPVRAPW